MKQPMYNRIVALLLALVLLFGYMPAPAISAQSDAQESTESEQQFVYDKLKINRDGATIDGLAILSNEKIEISAEGISENADYQWQVQHPEHDDVWVNIYDGTDSTISVTLALVENVLRDDGTAKLRCRAYTADCVYLSNTLTVSVVSDAETVPMLFSAAYDSSIALTAEDDSETTPEFVTVTIEYIRYDYVIQSDGTMLLEEMGAAFTPYVATLKAPGELKTSVPCPTIVGYNAYLVNDDGTETQITNVKLDLVDLTTNCTYTVKYKPAQVNYEVRYFFQNIYDDLYVEDANLVQSALKIDSYPVIAKGETGTHPDIQYTEASFTGFTSLYYEPETIAADGSTVFHVYYERNYYLMEFDCAGGYGTDTVYVRYGTYISVPIPVKSGWVFDGWDLVRTNQPDYSGTLSDGAKDELPATMPPYNTAYQALWKAADTTYSVAYWIQNGTEKIFIASTTNSAVSGDVVSGGDDISSVHLCEEQAHTHTAACYNCGLLEHTHTLTECDTNCAHTHTSECWSSLTNVGASSADQAAIFAIGENEPQVGYIYAINIVGETNTWFKTYVGTDDSGNHIWYSANMSMISGEALGIGTAGTYTARKYAANFSGYGSCTHIHGETCTYTCTSQEHTHGTDCTNCGQVEHTHHYHTVDCYLHAQASDASDQDIQAIKELENGTPQSGYIYVINASANNGDTQNYYKLYFDDGDGEVEKEDFYGIDASQVSGGVISELLASNNYRATKYAAVVRCGHTDCSNCSVGYEHTHTDACVPCGISTHIHTDDCKPEYANYIVYSHSDSNVTVEGDGSTVVNVYYTYKNLFQIRYIYAKEENGTYYLAATTNNGSLSSSTGGANWKYIVSELPTVVDPDDSTERKTVEIDGSTYYYISLTAAFGADIADKWPANNVTSVGGYYWGSWAAAPGSGYRIKYGDAHANIVGPYPTMSADMIVDGGTLLDESTGTYLAQYMVAWWADGSMNVATHAYHNYFEVLELPSESVQDEANFVLENVTYQRYTYTNNGITEVYIVNISGNENDGKIYRLETVSFSAAHNGDTRVDPVSFSGYTAINDSRNSDDDKQANSNNFINTDDSGNKLCSICDDSCNYCNSFIYNLNVHNLKFWNHNSWLQSGGTGAQVSYGAALQKYGAYVNADYMADKYPAGLEPGAYEFGGWYTTEQCLPGTEVDWETDTMPDAEMIVYAKWTPVTHDVYFYYDYEDYTSALNANESDKRDYFWYPNADTTYPVRVSHGDLLGTAYNAIPEAKEGYTFVGWFYIDDTGKKRFAPDTMEVKQELHLFAEWQSGFDTEYTVYYVREDGTPIAEPTTGHLTAGKTKTFTAKVGTELYESYQSINLFPTSNSHSILMVEDKAQNTYTFKYVEDDEVYYRVRYLDKITGLEVHPEKVEKSTAAIVTEKFVPVEGYVPESYYIRKVLAADGSATEPIEQNEIVFYYTPDETHGPYVIEYYTQVLGGSGDIDDADSWTLEQSEIGTADLGTTLPPRTIETGKFSGFEYFKASVTTYDADGKPTTVEVGSDAKTVSGTVTKNGLEVRIYYTRCSYDYTIQYVEYGTNNTLMSTTDKALYENSITHTAPNTYKEGTYLFYETPEKPQTQTMTIRATDTGNVMTFYYQAKTITINYQAVCHVNGAVDFGVVSLNSETVQSAENVVGSTAHPGEGYRFVAWYSDEACTEYKTGVETLKLTTLPAEDVTYYALFEPITDSLTITKGFIKDQREDSDNFLFRIQGQGKLSYIDLTVCINGNDSDLSVTIEDLPVGNYKITELTFWSWEYDCSEFEQTIKVKEAADNTVTFENSYTNSDWLESETSKDNLFTS